MPSFRIRITNDSFEASEESEFADQHAAAKRAIRSAITIAADELDGDVQFFAAEVCIEQGGEMLERHIVSVGKSPLL